MNPQEPIVQEPVVSNPIPDSNSKVSSKLNGITILSMAIFVLLSLGAVAFLYYQNQQLKTMLASYKTPVVSPTPIPTTNKIFNGYGSNFDPNVPRFDLDVPIECKKDSDDINCDEGDFRIAINPNEGGGKKSTATPFPKSPKITIGKYIWTRSISDMVESKDKIGSYFLRINETDYLVEVNYYPYSEFAQKYFEQILSTFKFLDQTSTDPVVTSPTANTKVSSPLTINGTVPAGWMFEGSFPIKIIDSTRALVAQGSAKEVTPSSWQSGKPVNFSVTLPFATTDNSGFLILMNDNPSGDTAKSKTFEVPLKF